MTNRFLHHVRLIFTRRDVLALLVVVGLAGVVVAAFAIQDAAAPAPVAVASGDNPIVPAPDVPFAGACTPYRVDVGGEHVVHLDNAGSANGLQGVVSSYRLEGTVVESGVIVGTGDGDCLQDAFPCAWSGGTPREVLGASSDDGKMAALFGFLTPGDEQDQGAHGTRWTFEVRSYARTADGTVWVSSLQRPVVVYAHDTPGGRYTPAYYCDVEEAGLV